MVRILSKQVNLLRSGYSFLASSVSGKPVIIGMPVSVSAELTNRCNLHCPECTTGSDIMKRERGFMDIELYRKVIDEFRPYLYYISLYFQGEPMMHPGFFLFPGIARDAYSVVSTNGHFLNAVNSERLVASGLKKLIVSLDGMDQEAYSKYRKGGDLFRVVSGIRNVAAARKKSGSSISLEIQFLVNRNNEYQIEDAVRFAKEVGARLKLKSMQVIDSQNIENWLPSANRFRRYRKTGDDFIIKSSLPNKCMRLWLNPVITWDGKVLPCCYDKDASYIMGDLNKESFRSIWNGKLYKEFRRQILTERDRIGICRNCTSGLRGVNC